MTAPVIVTSPEELARIVRDAVRAELAEQHANTSEILDIAAAALLLNVDEPTLRRYARTKQVPAAKLGSEWRFRRADLIAHLFERGTAPGGHTEQHAKTLKEAV